MLDCNLQLILKDINISQSAMMCEMLPQSTFQKNLEFFNNTGFCFWIFGCEEMNGLCFKEILEVFVFEFDTCIGLQAFWTMSTFQNRLKCIHSSFTHLAFDWNDPCIL